MMVPRMCIKKVTFDETIKNLYQNPEANRFYEKRLNTIQPD
jgi:hypothetical protein